MKTKRKEHEEWQTIINDNLDRKGMSDCRITFEEEVALQEKEKCLINAIVELLDFESNIIETDLPRICSSLLYALREQKEKIGKLQSLIHVLQTTLKTAEENNRINVGIMMGRIETKLLEQTKPSVIEYGVKEFAKLCNLHPHTVRSRFHKGLLKGRQDSKGIFIAAEELKE